MNEHDGDGPKVNIDKRHRICDKQGRPLRDHSVSSYKAAPFMGRDGKQHELTAYLEARQKLFDDLRPERQHGRKRPGSLKR